MEVAGGAETTAWTFASIRAVSIASTAPVALFTLSVICSAYRYASSCGSTVCTTYIDSPTCRSTARRSSVTRAVRTRESRGLLIDLSRTPDE